jgi:3D (Asp-Asp-Asp) domain-containing protein
MYIVTNDGKVTYGMAVAEDTGVRGNVIDLYHDTYRQCINFGRRGVTIYILE